MKDIKQKKKSKKVEKKKKNTFSGPVKLAWYFDQVRPTFDSSTSVNTS